MIPLLYAHGAVSDQLWAAWTFDPALIFLLFIALCYRRGAEHYRRSRLVQLSPLREWSFYLGVGLVFLALASPLDHLADEAFSFHMLQHLILSMFGPILILLGKPLLPVLRGSPKWLKQHLTRPVLRQTGVKPALKALVQTRWILPVTILVTWGWHHPYLYDLALFDTFWHYVEHACFFAVGLLFWWSLIPGLPKVYHPREAQVLLLLILSIMQNSALSSMITFSEIPLYGYVNTNRYLNLSMVDDQILGGLMMWILGGMMYWLAFTWIFYRLYRSEQLILAEAL